MPAEILCTPPVTASRLAIGILWMRDSSALHIERSSLAAFVRPVSVALANDHADFIPGSAANRTSAPY